MSKYFGIELVISKTLCVEMDDDATEEDAKEAAFDMVSDDFDIEDISCYNSEDIRSIQNLKRHADEAVDYTTK